MKTDGIGTIAIDWDDVERVTSATSFDIQLASGQRVFGSFARGDAGTVDVVTSSGEEVVPRGHRPDLTNRRHVLGRLKGAVDAGFSFTQANVQTQGTLNSRVSYRSRWSLSELDSDSALTSREDADRQTRNTLSLESPTISWPSLVGGWLRPVSAERGTVPQPAGGAGRRHPEDSVANRTRRCCRRWEGAFTREKFAGAEDESVAEAVAGQSWEWFTVDGRSTNLDAGALSFWVPSHDARVRLELNTSFKSDIVGDLYWSIHLFESYNSEPPPGRKNNDFGVLAAVGWSF